jgi:hypothetical protein
MNHPYELLADLMDGTLDEGDLAGVQAHLDACASCREDVADAKAGARAARSLPVEDPPADLHRRVVGAAGGRGTPSWYRWAGVAAAAAVVVAIAIALPNVGKEPANPASDSGGAAAERAEAQPAAEGVVVGVEDTDYDARSLEDLARSATRSSAEVSTNAAEDATFGNPDAAVRCVSRAFGNQQAGRLTRLIRARFEGEEAYIAVYLEGPGADQPPDTVAVWAASSKDCTILSFASARI